MRSGLANVLRIDVSDRASMAGHVGTGHGRREVIAPVAMGAAANPGAARLGRKFVRRDRHGDSGRVRHHTGGGLAASQGAARQRLCLSACRGARRIYAIESAPLQQVDAWLDRFRHFWAHRLEALATEIARGKRKRGR